MELHRTALVYDFDGTLAEGNVQEHSFLPQLGLSTGDFWKRVKELARQHDSDEILTYMGHMLGRCPLEGRQGHIGGPRRTWPQDAALCRGGQLV